METWQQVPKNQIDPEIIEEAIQRIVNEHDNEPTAHIGENKSLSEHRISEVCDHLAKSIVNDKIAEVSRAYTAIMQIPDTQLKNFFYETLDYVDSSFVKVNTIKSEIEIMSRTDTESDSEYIYLTNGNSRETYFSNTPPVFDVGQKLYKMKMRARVKLLNATVASANFDLYYGDGVTATRSATTSWQWVEWEIFYLYNGSGGWDIVDWNSIIDKYYGVLYYCPDADLTKNQLAISSFYIEGHEPVDYQKENFFDLTDCIKYLDSIGGGTVFVKNGIYNFDKTLPKIKSNISLYGEDPKNTIFNFDVGVGGLFLGDEKNSKYTSGTVTFSQNSITVTLSGATWTEANTVGNYILNKDNGHWYKIIAWINSTSITIDALYQGSTKGSLTYVIMQMCKDVLLSGVQINSFVTVRNLLDTTIENCIFKGLGFDWKYCENLNIKNNALENAQPSVQIDYLTNSYYQDNNVSNFSDTVLYLKNTCTGNQIKNNLVHDNKKQCFLIFGENNLILSNLVLNCGYTLGQNYSPILLGSTSTKNIISSNIVRRNNAYGIGSQTGANYNIVTNNIVIDNTQNGVVNNGANSVTANNIV